MIEPLIAVGIHGAGRVFTPGDVFSGEIQVDAVDPMDVQALEISVLWHTEGKGDEDLGVHHFERYLADDEHRGQLHQLRSFRTVLPASPLSYDGVNVKIRWCVRVRLFLSRGREVTADQTFQLGNIPPARMILPAAVVRP
jgi:hypothetical protein